MDKIKLKPCPFCGGGVQVLIMSPKLYRPNRINQDTYHVHCNHCELFFGWDYDYGGVFDTVEEAVAAWNYREG